jgi:hypothetical protein
VDELEAWWKFWPEDLKRQTTNNQWSNLEKERQDNQLSDDRRPQGVNNRQPMVEFGKGKTVNRLSDVRRPQRVDNQRPMVEFGKGKTVNRLSNDWRPQGVHNQQPMVKFGKGKTENRPSDDQRWAPQPTTNGQIRKRKNRITNCLTIEDLKGSTTNDQWLNSE